MITSVQIKLVKQLKEKKYRNKHGLFVVEGPKIIKELISRSFPINHIFATTAFLNSQEHIINKKEITVTAISDKELKSLSALSTPNEAVALCEIKHHKPTIEELESQWSIALESINDPGNLGTIIRIAHWLNIKNIICSEDTVDVYNNKAIQSTMGSIANVKVSYTNLKELFEGLNNKVPIFAACTTGKNMFECIFPKNGILLMGSESHGISNELRLSISNTISIPGASHDNRPESLNVAVATSMIGTELLRQKVL